MRTKNIARIITLALATAALAACGSGTTGYVGAVPGYGYNGYGYGGYAGYGGYGYGMYGMSLTGNFYSDCSMMGGSLAYASGQTVCRMSQGVYQTSSGSNVSSSRIYPIPVLTVNNPSGGTVTNLNVQGGELVTVTPSGSWGGVTKWGFGACDTDMDGRRNGRLEYNGVMPIMLLASDGSRVYEIGSGASFTAAGPGTIRFGFNTTESAVKCTKFSIKVAVQFKTPQCVSAASQNWNSPTACQ